MQTKFFAYHSDGEAHLYTLKNKNDTRLAVTDAGAAVVSLIYRGVDVALGWEKGEDYKSNPGSLGATVGRNANRIAGGRFRLNGETIQLAKNDGENNLHSGPDAYKKRLWQTVEANDERITFLMDSPDGDQGLPGHMRLFASYELNNEDIVTLSYRAVSDQDTILNPTNHTYFNLNGQDSGDARDHILRIYAKSFTPSDTGLIPTGEIAPVEGTPLDFQYAHAIGRDMDLRDPLLAAAKGYDHNYCLWGTGLRTAAELRGDKSGILLTVLTDRPGVQLYTANTFSARGGKNGAEYRPYCAVCLETQAWPDAVNHPDFPSTVLKAGETFFSRTIWRFSHPED